MDGTVRRVYYLLYFLRVLTVKLERDRDYEYSIVRVVSVSLLVRMSEWLCVQSHDLRIVRLALELALPGHKLEFLMSKQNQVLTFSSAPINN